MGRCCMHYFKYDTLEKIDEKKQKKKDKKVA
jgi:hypothetical protein